MKLWIGAETQADIIDKLRAARKEVETTINGVIENSSYDIELEKWMVIAVLRDDSVFNEIVKFSKARRWMDFRLRLEYERFARTDDSGRIEMLCELLLRSLQLLTEKGANAQGVSNLTHDVQAIAKSRAWIPA
jgi:hypothetical protein